VLRQRIKVASLSAMCRMVESGLGVGVMPRGAMRHLARRGQVRAITLTDDWARRGLLLYARSFDGLSVAARRFADHLAPADDV
jgi:DNA-binding transcriptional LysR family regulator